MSLNQILLIIITILNIVIISTIKKDESHTLPPVPVIHRNSAPIENPAPIVATKPTTYEEAVKQSKELKKPLFLFFHADWCMWCNKMMRETLTNDSVKTKLEQYVVFQIDYDISKEIVKKYGGGRLPFYLIEQDGKIIKKTEGYKNPKEFLLWLGEESAPAPAPDSRRRLFKLRGW